MRVLVYLDWIWILLAKRDDGGDKILDDISRRCGSARGCINTNYANICVAMHIAQGVMNGIKLG